MHTGSDGELKALIGELVSRLEFLEILGSQTSGKLEDLQRRVHDLTLARPVVNPVAVASPSATGLEPAGTSAGPNNPRDDRNGTTRNSFDFQSCRKTIPDLEHEIRKRYIREPRPPQAHRMNGDDAPSSPDHTFLGELDGDTMVTIRSLREMISRNPGVEASRENAEKLRFPMRRSGKLVLRRHTLHKGEAAPENEGFEDPTPGRVRHRRPWILFSVAMLLLSLLFLGGIMVASRLSTRILPGATAEPLARIQHVPFTFADSRKTLEQFLAASTVEEAAGHAHDQDSRLVERMREFYTRPGKGGWQGRLMDAKPSMTGASGGNSFHFWRVLASDGATRVAPVVRLGGRAFVYWEAYVGYGAMDWESFVEKRPENPVEMRVLLARTRNGFGMSGDCLLLEVSHPDSEVFEIVRVTDDWTRLAIEHCLRDSRNPVKAMVRMAYGVDASGISSPGITSFIGTGWGENQLVSLDSPALPGLVVKGSGLGIASEF